MPAYAIKVKTVIVIDNVLDTISALQGNLTGTVSTVETGVYTFENEALEELVMSSSSAPLLPGCYPVLSDTKTTASQPVKSSISVTKSTTLSTPTKSSSLSDRANNEGFYLFCRLTITLSSSTNTRLFNDYNGTGSCNPHKTHKTPPQNRSVAGFTYALKQPKSLIPSGFWAQKKSTVILSKLRWTYGK